MSETVTETNKHPILEAIGNFLWFVLKVQLALVVIKLIQLLNCLIFG